MTQITIISQDATYFKFKEANYHILNLKHLSDLEKLVSFRSVIPYEIAEKNITCKAVADIECMMTIDAGQSMKSSYQNIFSLKRIDHITLRDVIEINHQNHHKMFEIVEKELILLQDSLLFEMILEDTK